VHGYENRYIVEKQLHKGMLLEKEKELLLPADTDQRFGFIVWTSTQN